MLKSVAATALSVFQEAIRFDDCLMHASLAAHYHSVGFQPCMLECGGLDAGKTRLQVKPLAMVPCKTLALITIVPQNSEQKSSSCCSSLMRRTCLTSRDFPVIKSTRSKMKPSANLPVRSVHGDLSCEHRINNAAVAKRRGVLLGSAALALSAPIVHPEVINVAH